MKKLNYLLISLTIIVSACDIGLRGEEKAQISLSTETVKVDFDSNEHTVKVISPYSWIAESNNDWISLTSDNGIAGTEELRFVCERNLDESERKGTIVIKNKDFGLATELYVIQDAFVPQFEIEDISMLEFDYRGGEKTILIISNFDYQITANVDWLSCTKNDNSVSITAPSYYEIGNRSAEIIISNAKYNLSKTIQVLQYATPNGFLSVADLVVVCADEYSNVLNYKCSINNEAGECIRSFKYGERPTEPVELETGDYILKMQSGDVPSTAWESPVYGAEKAFRIVRSETMILSEITCMLMQIKVTITFTPDLIERLGTNTLTTVKVDDKSLEYTLTESRAGFFAAPQVNNTVEINISGTYSTDIVNYKSISMSKELYGVKIGDEIEVNFYISSATEDTISGKVLIMRNDGNGSR